MQSRPLISSELLFFSQHSARLGPSKGYGANRRKDEASSLDSSDAVIITEGNQNSERGDEARRGSESVKSSISRFDSSVKSGASTLGDGETRPKAGPFWESARDDAVIVHCADQGVVRLLGSDPRVPMEGEVLSNRSGVFSAPQWHPTNNTLVFFVEEILKGQKLMDLSGVDMYERMAPGEEGRDLMSQTQKSRSDRDALRGVQGGVAEEGQEEARNGRSLEGADVNKRSPGARTSMVPPEIQNIEEHCREVGGDTSELKGRSVLCVC